MITMEALRTFGADTDKGLERCMNKEDFYLRLVCMAVEDANVEKLRAAIENNDLDQAFEAAHALKGTTGNLSLDPLYEPLCEITELLRARTETDYSELMGRILGKYDELKSFAG